MGWGSLATNGHIQVESRTDGHWGVTPGINGQSMHHGLGHRRARESTQILRKKLRGSQTVKNLSRLWMYQNGRSPPSETSEVMPHGLQ